MSRVILACVTLSLVLAAPSVQAAEPPAVVRHSTPEDIAAIHGVVDDFMSAIKAKDGRRLSTLVLNSQILFTSPGDQASVDDVRKYNPNFTGVGVGGFTSFARYISTTNETIEEKFRNVEIVQDGPLALVTFDYEFWSNGTFSNGGMEHWQMRKTDGKWKIFSVVWTQ